MERFLAQRQRLVRAVALAVLEGSSTVQRVIELAGVGRGTFYECFDDFEHALENVLSAELARLREACVVGERRSIGALVEAWCGAVALEPELVRVALRLDASDDSNSIGSVFASALVERMAAPVTKQAERLEMIAACAAGCARALALELCSMSSADAKAPTQDAHERKTVPLAKSSSWLSVVVERLLEGDGAVGKSVDKLR